MVGGISAHLGCNTHLTSILPSGKVKSYLELEPSAVKVCKRLYVTEKPAGAYAGLLNKAA